MRTIKVRAARETRTLKDLVADLPRRGLALEIEEPGAVRNRVRLPLVQCAHDARPDEGSCPIRLRLVHHDEADRNRALLRA